MGPKNVEISVGVWVVSTGPDSLALETVSGEDVVHWDVKRQICVKADS